MVDNTYVETLQRKPSYIEDLEKGIFDSLFYERDPEKGDYRKDEEGNKVFGGLLGTSVPQEINREALFNLPDYVVAALDPLQTQAYTKIGSDAFLNRLDPYFKTGTDPTTGQESALSKALTTLGTVPGELAKGLGSFDPSEIDPETGELKIDRFMNPYQQEVIDEAIKQIDRQSKLARIADDARAIQAGAFGGSRQGVQRAETASRVQEAKNKTISDLLSKGYSSALSSSMAAEESARDRALKSGQLTGGLGQQYGSLAGTSADIGRVYSGITGQDLAALAGAGAQKQAFEQTKEDAARASALLPLKQALAPLTIGQQFISGSPSAGTVSQYQQTFEPSPNPFLQGVGTAAALQGLYK